MGWFAVASLIGFLFYQSWRGRSAHPVRFLHGPPPPSGGAPAARKLLLAAVIVALLGWTAATVWRATGDIAAGMPASVLLARETGALAAILASGTTARV